MLGGPASDIWHHLRFTFRLTFLACLNNIYGDRHRQHRHWQRLWRWRQHSQMLKFSRPHYFITLSSISFAARPSPQGFLCGVRMCACCCCVYMIKMTCTVNWIIVRERRAESTSLSCPDLAGSRGKTVSRHLELMLDAVDDHDVFSALSCFSCSTTCCCIAVWAIESEK